MAENMGIYNRTREVPVEAKKPIDFGKMKGKTDINPMWRIKTLTEEFGPCGFGWVTEIISERLENLAGGQVACFVDINLYIVVDGKKSMAIPGIGGNMFIRKTKNGLEVNDECYKMAYTDAIGVACKSLGFGANVYWDSDRTKYDIQDDKIDKKQNTKQELSDAQIKRLYAISKTKGITEQQVKEVIKKSYNKESTKELTKKEYDEIVKRMEAKEDAK